MKFIILTILLSLSNQAIAGLELKDTSEETRFREYINKVMEHSKVPFSVTKKETLIDKIVMVRNKYKHSKETMEAFVIVLAIESGFRDGLVSEAGAKGISQIMPEYFVDFAKECGLDVKTTDIDDPDVNLVVGACRFNTIMKTEQNPFVAIAAYHAGLRSITVKKLKAGKKINPQTADYIEKYKKIVSKVQ